MDSDDKDQASARELIEVLFKSGERLVLEGENGSLAALSKHTSDHGFTGAYAGPCVALNLSEVAAICLSEDGPEDDADIPHPLVPQQSPSPAQIKRARQLLGIADDAPLIVGIDDNGNVIARRLLENFQIIPAEEDQG